MNVRQLCQIIAVGFAVLVGGRVCFAAEAPPVELPPMIVEETAKAPQWLYVNAEGTEFLSRCSAATTRAYIESWRRGMRLIRTLVPEDFLARMDVPPVMVLYAQDLKQPVSAEIQRALRRTQMNAAGSFSREFPGGEGYGYAPNMRLDDRDMHASFVYIDEGRFDADNLIVAPDYLRFHLERRVPLLPAWLIAGIDRTYREADFVQKPITFRPLVWTTPWEVDEMREDRERPRALLPANELFAPDSLRGPGNRHPERVKVLESQATLFFRWAIASSGPTRDALWRFSARAATEPVTEIMFEECFGFGFSELRDRLSDYLPGVMQTAQRIDPGRAPAASRPRIAIRPATPNEIARLRGEWERLAIGYVQGRFPQLRDRYADQARRTLRRAYDQGDRDPRLLATMGLCEIAAGNEAAARGFLQAAIDANVVRPRAYYEMARLHFADLKQAHSLPGLFSRNDLTPVLDLLQRGVLQAPPLPEAYGLLAEVWVRCNQAPTAADWTLLETGARLYARRPVVSFRIALAYARHGRKTEAEALLAAGADYITDDITRRQVDELRTALAR